MDDAASRLSATLADATHQLHRAIGATRGTRTVAERTALLTAWTAVYAVWMLSVARRAGAPPMTPASSTLAAQLQTHVDELVGDGSTAIDVRAVRVYGDARALAAMMGSAGSSTPQSAVSAPRCRRRSDGIIADLGALATTELLLGTTRVGLPWIALSANELVSRTDRQRLVRPGWAHDQPPLNGGNLALSHAFGGWSLAAKTETMAAFDRAQRAGYAPRTALALAEHTDISGASLVLLEVGVKAQLDAITAAPNGAANDFMHVGALVGGLRSGARARAVALATEQPPGITQDGEALWTSADLELMEAQRELSDCVLTIEAGAARDASVVALFMIVAYRAQGVGCDAGGAPACAAERSCTKDADCMPLSSPLAQTPPRCVAVAEQPGALIKMCLGVGWICRTGADCGPGTECDRTIDRCVAREDYRCGGLQRCRTVEHCASSAGPPRCRANSPAAGQPCERNEANGALLRGACRIGTWRMLEGRPQCAVDTTRLERCDRRD